MYIYQQKRLYFLNLKKKHSANLYWSTKALTLSFFAKLKVNSILRLYFWRKFNKNQFIFFLFRAKKPGELLNKVIHSFFYFSPLRNSYFVNFFNKSRLAIFSRYSVRKLCRFSFLSSSDKKIVYFLTKFWGFQFFNKLKIRKGLRRLLSLGHPVKELQPSHVFSSFFFLAPRLRRNRLKKTSLIFSMKCSLPLTFFFNFLKLKKKVKLAKYLKFHLIFLFNNVKTHYTNLRIGKKHALVLEKRTKRAFAKPVIKLSKKSRFLKKIISFLSSDSLLPLFFNKQQFNFYLNL